MEIKHIKDLGTLKKMLEAVSAHLYRAKKDGDIKKSEELCKLFDEVNDRMKEVVLD